MHMLINNKLSQVFNSNQQLKIQVRYRCDTTYLGVRTNRNFKVNKCILKLKFICFLKIMIYALSDLKVHIVMLIKRIFPKI